MMNSTKTLSLSLKLAGAGVLQFFVLSALAMLLYPGGTISQPELTQYSFTNNFFSDLGRWHTFAGEVNSPVFWIFNSAVVLAGLATALFALTFPLLQIPVGLKHHAKAAGFFGLFAGLCYVGVGLTPWDIYFQAHILFVKAGFSSFLLANILLGYIIFKTPGFANAYAWVCMAFVGILAAYLVLLFFGPNNPAIPWQLSLQVIAQKVLLYTQMTTMMLLVVGTYRFNQ